MRTEARYKEGLKALIKETPLEEITVAMLCAKVKSTRQTFYYHYRDIFDVVHSIMLQEKIEYAKVEGDDFSSCVRSMVAYTNKNFDFLYAVSNSFAKETLEQLYYSFAYKKVKESLIKNRVGDKSKSEEDIARYLSTIFTKELIVYISTKKQEKVYSLVGRLQIIWNYFMNSYKKDLEKA